MSAEHFALHIGALCVLTVIVGIAVMVAPPERVHAGATSLKPSNRRK
jgi:hypothetical protein